MNNKRPYATPSMIEYGKAAEFIQNSPAIRQTDVPIGTPVDPTAGLGPITS